MLNATKILVVDDHPIVREGLGMQIATQPDLCVCGEAEDVPSALALVEAQQPNVVIVDILLKNGNGLDLIRRITERHIDVRILVWSMYPENLYAERALHAGAHGYLHKSQATVHILDAIRAILDGKLYVSGETTGSLLRRVVGRATTIRSPMEALSNRELEGFEMMGHGMTTESIANKMHVSAKTVETYRARIKEKLGLENVNQLIQRASQWVMEYK
jgi:DNA-binding NarL/FixJ family response regulator